MARVLFAEGWDKEVKTAVADLAGSRPGHRYEVLLKKEHKDNNDLIISSLKHTGVKYHVCEEGGYEAPYAEAVKQLSANLTDILFAGADIPHFSFLPILFRGLKVHRSTDLLTSFALIEGKIEGRDRQIIMLDPTVVTNPSDEELTRMTKSVIAVGSQLLGKTPTVALISHATGKDRPERSTKQSRVISMLKSEGISGVIPEPLQLDTALYRSVASKKLGRISTTPNILVMPDITSANVLYKSIEHFGGDKMKITSHLLWRSPIGNVGLLPRTTTKDQILKSFDILVNMARISK